MIQLGALMLTLLVALPRIAGAQGHGPVFALSTPTLARGGWSVDLAAMGRLTAAGDMAQFRPMVSYGVTEDLQISLSAPVPVYRAAGLRPVRGTARMPATPDVEATLGWRFHRRAPRVGTRFESTAYVALGYPTDVARGGIATAPAATGALVTGFASRTVYVWVGGLYQRALAARDTRAGDLVMYSAALGWRPPAFRTDYPRPDWRVFVEVLGEWRSPDVLNGTSVANTGGHQLFLAPTVLGLYGSWGIAGGPAVPVVRVPRGTQPAERVRWVVNLILWF